LQEGDIFRPMGDFPRIGLNRENYEGHLPQTDVERPNSRRPRVSRTTREERAERKKYSGGL
jgi:hypothetical protein